MMSSISLALLSSPELSTSTPSFLGLLALVVPLYTIAAEATPLLELPRLLSMLPSSRSTPLRYDPTLPCFSLAIVGVVMFLTY